MPPPSDAQDISNCLSASFDPGDDSSPGNWSLCYNQNKNSLSLSVHLNPPGSIIESATPLVSTIDPQGLTEMINFLYQVNLQVQKQAKTQQD